MRKKELLAVNEEFLSFQGEGMNTGIKMYFVRLQGCSVGCYFCDTKHSWRSADQTTDEHDIIKRALQTDAEWICITGGEPTEQDLERLIQSAHAEGFKVALETAGTNYDYYLCLLLDHITLSPKNLFSEKKLDRKFLHHAKELKCTVTKESDIDFYYKEFPTTSRPFFKSFIPVDNNPEIAQFLIKKCKPGWRVLCQQQKTLSLQ